jgi:hypothetical protein
MFLRESKQGPLSGIVIFQKWNSTQKTVCFVELNPVFSWISKKTSGGHPNAVPARGKVGG